MVAEDSYLLYVRFARPIVIPVDSTSGILGWSLITRTRYVEQFAGSMRSRHALDLKEIKDGENFYPIAAPVRANGARAFVDI
jgi:hypothetical protein